MTGKDVLKSALSSTQHMLGMFVADLSDADLLARPVPNANHIAWQLGHIIVGEHSFVSVAGGGALVPKLPEGFAEKHTKKTASEDSPGAFFTKVEYMDLANKTREAALATLDKLNDADFDKPTTGDIARFAPTIGSVFMLIANHTMMHAGQFSVVRRKLGKPVLL